MEDVELMHTVGDGEPVVDDPAATEPTPEIRPLDIEGPLAPAVWKIAWPAIITNLFSGLQGWVDHIMVGQSDRLSRQTPRSG